MEGECKTRIVIRILMRYQIRHALVQYGADTILEDVNFEVHTGMNRREFAEYFGIPYRTMQDWELGNRKVPKYLLRLMAYKVSMDKICKEEGEKENV